MPIHIKDGEKGPMVREVKVIEFRMQRDGLPTRPHWLIAARNPDEPDDVKFFVSNAPAGTPWEWLVYVAYSRFLTTPGIEPTNNLAEQAIRFVVIDRRITQGTRSERGQRWCERIWTAIATCTQQGQSVFEYLREAVNTHFNDQPIPPLIRAGP